ncbi:MAG: oligopeptide/dipeptide ABC transporter ATP-binding protein [bacterium]
MPLLEVKDLRVNFEGSAGLFKKTCVRAVRGVSFTLEKGESLGLVGESGCGKTTLGRSILRLIKPTSGSVVFNGRNVTSLKGKSLKEFRQSAQIIFQDPYESLNPRLSVNSVLHEVLKIHRSVPKEQRKDRVQDLLVSVGLNPGYAARFPHEFSGGQRQRIGIARAIAVNPLLIIADEPVSSLDVSVQVQILNLMKELQTKLKLSYLFVAHDLAVVRYMCDRVMVMYLGEIVETAATEDLFEHPSHPYTRALLSAVPDIEKGLNAKLHGSSRIILKGDVPSPSMTIPGCPFHPRCQRAEPICLNTVPPRIALSAGHWSACHFAGTLD